jgi:transcriptional regulator with XRE-family HTH domain
MKKVDPAATVFRAMRELVLSADASDLAAAVREEGIDPAELARAGRAAGARALDAATAASKATDETELHEGFSVLLQLLRRRDALSHEQLAERARIDADELRRIENDRTYAPRPRTVYQLEQFFQLPTRSLAKLAGMKRDLTPQYTEEVLRFAASSKTIHKLTPDEARLLNAFVRFLSADAAGDE